MSIYDYSFERLTGEEKESLAKYKNQVLLIVNTASKCGFTPQYEGLEHLYEKYKDKGFAVLGFPSDSFMKQEFDESEKIAAFCQANYGVTFPLFKKSKMKGKEMNPLFAELLEQAGEKKLHGILINFSSIGTAMSSAITAHGQNRKSWRQRLRNCCRHNNKKAQRFGNSPNVTLILSVHLK